MAFQLKTTRGAPVDQALREQFKEAFDTALLELADYLQKESPRGVSPSGNSLAGSWDVRPSQKRRGIIPEVLGSVINTADAAEFRIRGRGPGGFPPFGEGTSIGAWAAAVGIPAYVVAKTIAEKGTERWRTKDNILDQDPVTLKFGKNSPLKTVFERKLAEEWNKITV